MNILAFDTCFGACSAALSWQRRTEVAVPDAPRQKIVSRCELMAKGHAERLIPMIGEVLAEASIGLAEVDRIAVTIGPGTFTGARIGVAAARALALASNAKVAGVGSLALLGRQVRERLLRERSVEVLGPDAGMAPRWILEEFADKDVAVAVDARRDEVYFQLFGGDHYSALTEPLLIRCEQATVYLRERETLVAGSGAARLVAAARAGGRHLLARFHDIEPDARYLTSFTQAPGVGAGAVRPLYLRAPDAKPQDGKSLPRAP
jgi:tRNA threonylcarbamoyl adenosine modification protein YeaZ